MMIDSDYLSSLPQLMHIIVQYNGYLLYFAKHLLFVYIL